MADQESRYDITFEITTKSSGNGETENIKWAWKIFDVSKNRNFDANVTEWFHVRKVGEVKGRKFSPHLELKKLAMKPLIGAKIIERRTNPETFHGFEYRNVNYARMVKIQNTSIKALQRTTKLGDKMERFVMKRTRKEAKQNPGIIN